ncbi:MAG: VOC family protein [Bacillota bacterium]
MEPMLKNVAQVAIVVKDCDAMVKKYADDYGIGPWIIYEFNPDTVENMIIRGERVDYAMRLALCNIGNVQWEIIEPKDDKSIYAEFLKEHGEGLHHCAFIADYNEFDQKMKSKGYKVLQAGTWTGFTYTYYPTQEELGVIVETYDVPEGWEWPEPDAVYPPK